MITDMKTIPLSNGKHALVDDLDYDLVSKFKWHAHCNGFTWYARCSIKGGRVLLMHRLLLAVSDSSMQVDHIDHDGLNNQRENLRLCTHSCNMKNRRFSRVNKSGYKGVSSKNGHWLAAIGNNGKTQHIGCFKTKEEAALAYDITAMDKYGSFALTNRDLGLLKYSGVLEFPTKLKLKKISRFKGVSRSRDKWMASAQIKGQFHYFGVHDTEEKAYTAYLEGMRNLSL